MNNNIMNVFMQMMGGGNKNIDPNQLMNMLGNNPNFIQAQKMMQGKNPQQMQQTIMNIARQKGMDEKQLKEMANKFGIKL